MKTVRKIAEMTEAIDAEQSIVGWGSKPIPDRDGELIESSAWKLEQYKKNPVLMLSHDYSSPPVGKCLWVKADNNGLKFKAKFANTERGREIYQLYKEGIMNGFSVGFSVNSGGSIDHPSDPKYKGLKRVYKDVELLEISCVAIPACPEALIEQVKSGKIQCKQLKDELDHVIEIVEKAKLGDMEVVQKPEVTENTVRVPVGDGDHTDHKMRTIAISEKEGIQALYCVDCKQVMTYIFDKEKWDMEEAKKWVDEHKKDYEAIEVGEDGGIVKKEESVEINVTINAVDAEAFARFCKENPNFVTDAIVAAQKATPKCPAGGEFGTDYGEYDECEECSFAERCEVEEKACRKPKEEEEEEEEEGGKKKPVQKMRDADGSPSVYDLVSLLNQCLHSGLTTAAERPVMVGEAKVMADSPGSGYVVDVFPTEYPSGSFVFSTGNKYYRMDYRYEEGECELIGGAEEVAQSWVAAKYEIAPQKKEVEEEDVVAKAGRVISSKNRDLISNCITQMQEAVDVLDDLLAATDQTSDDDEEEGDEKGLGLEIEQKEFDLSDIVPPQKKSAEKTDADDEEGEGFEIDPEMLKKAIKDVYSEVLKGGMEEAVINAVKKVKGNVI